jgi:hypothetical protein
MGGLVVPALSWPGRDTIPALERFKRFNRLKAGLHTRDLKFVVQALAWLRLGRDFPTLPGSLKAGLRAKAES